MLKEKSKAILKEIGIGTVFVAGSPWLDKEKLPYFSMPLGKLTSKASLQFLKNKLGDIGPDTLKTISVKPMHWYMIVSSKGDKDHITTKLIKELMSLPITSFVTRLREAKRQVSRG